MAQRIPSTLRTTISHIPLGTTPRITPAFSSSRSYASGKSQTPTSRPSKYDQSRHEIIVDNQENIKSDSTAGPPKPPRPLSPAET